MQLLFEEDRDGLKALAAADEPCPWSEGARFVSRAVSRSLEADRDFIGTLCNVRISGVHLTDIETPADIEKASALLRVAEATRGASLPRICILARLDTAQAALGLADFNRPIPRLCGFLFDAAALAVATGASANGALIADLQTRLPLAARVSAAFAILRCPGAINADEAESAARAGYHGLCRTAAQ